MALRRVRPTACSGRSVSCSAAAAAVLALTAVMTTASAGAGAGAADPPRQLGRDLRPAAHRALVSPTPVTSGWVWNLAPRMRLHTSEDRNPRSPINFVKYSRIKWVHDAGCDDHANPDDLPSESKLSGGGYTHWTAASDCSHQATTWTSKQYTAVGETYDSPRPGGLEGFTLNLDDDMRDGGAFNADEPVIVRTDNNWIQYWFNFGDSQNLSGSGHEGDWERISIRLSDKNVPKEVEYSFHHDKCTLCGTTCRSSTATARSCGWPSALTVQTRRGRRRPSSAATRT